MNLIFPNFTQEYYAYNVSANNAKQNISEFNKNYSFPDTDTVKQLNDRNIIIGPYVSRITIRKYKLTHIVNSFVDVYFFLTIFNKDYVSGILGILKRYL